MCTSIILRKIIKHSTVELYGPPADKRYLRTFCNMLSYMHFKIHKHHMGRAKRIWYLSHMRAAKVQASLRIRAVSPEPPLLAHTSSESRGTFRQKARSLAPLDDWACAVKICHDGMLEDTNSLDGAHILFTVIHGLCIVADLIF